MVGRALWKEGRKEGRVSFCYSPHARPYIVCALSLGLAPCLSSALLFGLTSAVARSRKHFAAAAVGSRPNIDITAYGKSRKARESAARQAGRLDVSSPAAILKYFAGCTPRRTEYYGLSPLLPASLFEIYRPILSLLRPISQTSIILCGFFPLFLPLSLPLHLFLFLFSPHYGHVNSARVNLAWRAISSLSIHLRAHSIYIVFRVKLRVSILGKDLTCRVIPWYTLAIYKVICWASKCGQGSTRLARLSWDSNCRGYLPREQGTRENRFRAATRERVIRAASSHNEQGRDAR